MANSRGGTTDGPSLCLHLLGNWKRPADVVKDRGPSSVVSAISTETTPARSTLRGPKIMSRKSSLSTFKIAHLESVTDQAKPSLLKRFINGLKSVATKPSSETTEVKPPRVTSIQDNTTGSEASAVVPASTSSNPPSTTVTTVALEERQDAGKLTSSKPPSAIAKPLTPNILPATSKPNKQEDESKTTLSKPSTSIPENPQSKQLPHAYKSKELPPHDSTSAITGNPSLVHCSAFNPTGISLAAANVPSINYPTTIYGSRSQLEVPHSINKMTAEACRMTEDLAAWLVRENKQFEDIDHLYALEGDTVRLENTKTFIKLAPKLRSRAAGQVGMAIVYAEETKSQPSVSTARDEVVHAVALQSRVWIGSGE